MDDLLCSYLSTAGNRRHLEALGVAAPIVRILGSDSATDVMRMYACWALSNLTADGPSAAIQEVTRPTRDRLDTKRPCVLTVRATFLLCRSWMLAGCCTR
jgi:hypothetical protein